MCKDVSYFLKKLQASAYFLTYNPPEKNKISTRINVKYQLLTPKRKGLERLAPLICAVTLSDPTGHREVFSYLPFHTLHSFLTVPIKTKDVSNSTIARFAFV